MDASNEYLNYKNKALFKILSYILDSVNEDGSWGSSDYEDWKCILTTLTADLLLSCNIEPNATWFVNNKKIEFSKTIQFLNNSIQDTGACGEDYWDACRLGVLINKYSLQDKFSNFQKLHTYIIQSIDQKVYQSKNEGWSGPGFYAITIDYLDSIKIMDVTLSNIANTIYDELIRQQSTDGSFRGATNKTGQEFVSPIWHTFQVLQTLLRRGVPQTDEKIKKIVDWVKQEQEDDGSFKDYKFTIMCTSYIITSLSNLNDCQDTIKKGLGFLHNQLHNPKLDSAQRIMLALALRSAENTQLYFNATILDLKNLETLESLNEELTNEFNQCKSNLSEKETKLQEYEKKYKDVGVVFTQTQAWLLGIILGLVFTVLVSAVFYLLGTKQDNLSNSNKTDTQYEIPIEHK